jgi:hypothetical protein
VAYVVYFFLTGGAGWQNVEGLLRLHLALTLPAYPILFAFREGSTNWPDTLAREYVITALLCLTFWTAAGGLLWARTTRNLRERATIDENAPVTPSLLGDWLFGSWRRATVTAALAAAVVASLTLAWSAVRSWEEARLEETLAELDRADPRWRLTDLEARRAVVADADNAALRVSAVAKSLGPRWVDGWPSAGAVQRALGNPQLAELIRDLGPEVALEKWQAEELRADVAPVTPARDLARGLETMPRGRFPVDWSTDLHEPFPRVNDSYAVARLLWLDLVLRTHEGDIDGALATARARLNAAHAFGDEPALLSQAVRATVNMWTVLAVERALAQGEATEAALAPTQKLLADEAVQPLLQVGVRGERARIHEALRAVEEGRIALSALREVNERFASNLMDMLSAGAGKDPHVDVLRVMSDLAALVQRPAAEHEQSLQQREAERLRHTSLVAAWAVYRADTIGARFHHAESSVRCAVAGLAAERFRLAHGQWPETLSELVPDWLPAAPTDSAGGALRYRRRADGVVIWSVGPYCGDKGGEMDRQLPDSAGSPVGFRLWDISQRRQPPKVKTAIEEK